MDSQTRAQLRQLLNKMIYDGEEVGVLQKASVVDDHIETETYRLLLSKKVARFL